MDIPVFYPGFEGRGLLVRSGLVADAALWVDGAQVKKTKGSCFLVDNLGRSVEVRFKARPFDPLPRLQIGNETIQLKAPLKAYEYLWAALPLTLILVGGMLGGALGGAAAFLNLRVFGTSCSYGLKYVITAAISVVAFVSFLILAAVIATVLKLG